MRTLAKNLIIILMLGPRIAIAERGETASALPKSDLQASAASTSSMEISPNINDPFHGWEYLVNKLEHDGVPPSDLRIVYGDPRMPAFGEIPFRLNPVEGRGVYRSFLDPERITLARGYLQQYRRSFNDATNTFKVSPYVIAAILLVETQFGRATGQQLVINRLSRLAAIDEPRNIEWNFVRLRTEDSNVTRAEVEKRARYLEETFYPELPALFEAAARYKIDILGLRGSSAGAFGFPQFLPSTFLHFGMDGDRDGSVSLFNLPDSIISVAHFLNAFGWNSGLPLGHPDNRATLWKYNRSQAYVDTVVKVAAILSDDPGHKRH